MQACVAVEVWEDESGVLERIEIPKRDDLKGVKLYFKKGERYVAPPEKNVPLARFYVLGKDDVLKKARKIREEVVVEFKS